MTVLSDVAYYLALGVNSLWRVAQIVCFLLGLWALIDCVMRKSEHFIAADKRTKGFWLGVNGAGIAVVAIMGFASMLGLIGFVANAVYLTDVRPALDFYKPVRVRSQIRSTDDPRWRR